MFLSLLTSLYLHLQRDIIPFCYSLILGAIVELPATMNRNTFWATIFQDAIDVVYISYGWVYNFRFGF